MATVKPLVDKDRVLDILERLEGVSNPSGRLEIVLIAILDELRLANNDRRPVNEKELALRAEAKKAQEALTGLRGGAK